mmetsp:Transcript_32814/g.45785  ORF Transcript_32814/g.45785 Transcript_32814/m.45785 type:complete len:96 (+) Transcript_32814:1858-2145(+)
MEIGHAIYLKSSMDAFDNRNTKDSSSQNNENYKNEFVKEDKMEIIIQTVASSLRTLLTEAFKRKCIRNCKEIISAASFDGIECAINELIAMIKNK